MFFKYRYINSNNNWPCHKIICVLFKIQAVTPFVAADVQFYLYSASKSAILTNIHDQDQRKERNLFMDIPSVLAALIALFYTFTPGYLRDVGELNYIEAFSHKCNFYFVSVDMDTTSTN